MAHACDKRCEGAEERHEARDDDRKPTIFLEEVVELVHAFFGKRLYPARIDDARTEETRDPIVRRIAQNRCRVEDDERCDDVEPSPICRKDTRSKEQRITRLERKEDQAGFHENDEEQRGIDPNRAQRYDPPRNERTGVFQKTYEEIDDIQQIILYVWLMVLYLFFTSCPNTRISRIGKGARQRSLMAASSRT